CSMPIRGGSSGCACAAFRRRRVRRRSPVPDLPISVAFEADAWIGPLQRLAAWIADLTGWRRYGLALLLGALAAGALPPVDLVPLLVVSFSGLVWLAEPCRGWRQAFALGWWFGFGFFL